MPAFIADAAANGISDGSTGADQPSACIVNGAAVDPGRSCGTLGFTGAGDVDIGYPFLGNGGLCTLQIAAKF